LYLKEAYGDCVEFSDNDGKFDLNEYQDQHNFDVMGTRLNNFRTPPLPTSQIASSSSVSSSQSSRRSSVPPLAKVKVTRADIGPNGKPSNIHLHNLHVHINIYSEADACIAYIQEKVRDEMIDPSLTLVGTSGLTYHDNDGTKGNCYSYSQNLI